MKGKYNVIIAERADNMLLLHTEFLTRVSPVAARRLLSDFKKTIARLAADPYQFPFADEFDAPGIPEKTYRKCLFVTRYKALFLIDNNDVFIDAIVDCRQSNSEYY
jgi:plasmid stabilization system protein ParE